MDKKDKLIALSRWLIVQEAEIGCFWQTLKKNSICAHKKRSQLIWYSVWKNQYEASDKLTFSFHL